MHDAGPRLRCCSRDENRQGQQHSKLPRLHAKRPPRAVEARVIGAQPRLPRHPRRRKISPPWRFVRTVGDTLLSPPIPSRKGANPHRDDLSRIPDRGRRPVTRADQDTMGLPDDLLVPSPQVRPLIEHQFHLERRRRAHCIASAASASWDEGWGASSAPRGGGHGSVRSRCRRSCWHLRHVARCLSSFARSGTEKGSALGGPLRTYVFLVAGTGFEPVTSGL
jgi:hypothetical protein